MWESGQWMDTSYAACTLGGARCKHQVLRHDVEEIQRWPPANCHHVHDAQEWTPYTSDGKRFYPSKEEAEYTAVLSFAIAVSASWWAVRKGLAKLSVPAFLPVGRREHWLDMDPRAMREWAMAPLAVTLGLTEALRAERPGLPVRKFVKDVMVENNSLAPKHFTLAAGVSTIVCLQPNGDHPGHRATTARPVSGLPGTLSTYGRRHFGTPCLSSKVWP